MFEDNFKKVLGIEGAYSDHKNDSGGKTMWGVTEALARRYGYTGSMKLLPLDLAKRIYKEEFWEPLRLTDIDCISQAIAEEMFDTAVNQGCVKAAIYLQQALNGLNRQAADYPDIAEDGKIGTVTINTLMKYLTVRKSQDGELVMLRALNIQQGAFYINLATKRKTDEDFLFGWIKNRVVI